jgi:hypothetical protein
VLSLAVVLYVAATLLLRSIPLRDNATAALGGARQSPRA